MNRWEIKIIDESPLLGDSRNPVELVAKLTVETDEKTICFLCSKLKLIFNCKIEATEIEEIAYRRWTW